MSLQPGGSPSVPQETRRIARAAFPRGNIYRRMCDELGAISELITATDVEKALCYQLTTGWGDGIDVATWNAPNRDYYSRSTAGARKISAIVPSWAIGIPTLCGMNPSNRWSTLRSAAPGVPSGA